MGSGRGRLEWKEKRRGDGRGGSCDGPGEMGQKPEVGHGGQSRKERPRGRGTDGMGWRGRWPGGREPRGLPDARPGLEGQ